MAVRVEDDFLKKNCKTNLRKATMKHDRSVVLIHHDSTEIWESTCGLTLVIGTLKIMASTGVFVHVVFVLKRSIS